MQEKIIVEFGIEKSIEGDYGYEEKYLTFRGEPTPYKAILKDGQLVAIVSRRYKLIENERVVEVCKKIKDQLGFDDMRVVDNFPRVHIHLIRDDSSVIVHNSVDGSFALRVDLAVPISGSYVIVRTDEIREMYRKHIGDVTVETLPRIISKVLEFSDHIKLAIEDLQRFSIKENKDIIDGLKELLPKKYTQTVLWAIRSRPDMNLKEIYEIVASKIWNAKGIDMKRKIRLFERLNKLILLPIVLR